MKFKDLLDFSCLPSRERASVVHVPPVSLGKLHRSLRLPICLFVCNVDRLQAAMWRRRIQLPDGTTDAFPIRLPNSGLQWRRNELADRRAWQIAITCFSPFFSPSFSANFRGDRPLAISTKPRARPPRTRDKKLIGARLFPFVHSVSSQPRRTYYRDNCSLMKKKKDKKFASFSRQPLRVATLSATERHADIRARISRSLYIALT